MRNYLKEKEYPGRGVVIGVLEPKKVFGATFVEGRSPSSQARKYVQRGCIISTEPTDEETLKKGSPDLLLYNAIAWVPGLIVVSNGKQTDSIMTGTLSGYMSLEQCARQWNYEPDSPIYTPRVHGRVVVPHGYPADVAVGELGMIVKGEDGLADRWGWTKFTETHQAQAWFVSTYQGDRQDVKSFDQDALPLALESKDAAGVCEEIGDMLQHDLRVGVAAVVMDSQGQFESAILNYRE